MKTWGFIIRYINKSGEEKEVQFSVDADTFRDASSLAFDYADKIVKSKGMDFFKLRFDASGEGSSAAGCKYCQNGTMTGIEEIARGGNYELVHTIGRKYQMGCDEYIEAEFEFEFCPKCGRKLEVEG